MKKLLIIAALSVASLSLANARTFEVTLRNPTAVGQTELDAGRYQVTVKNGFAQFMNLDTDHGVFVPVRVDTGIDQYDVTAVDLKSENGVTKIESIAIQNTNNKLEF